MEAYIIVICEYKQHKIIFAPKWDITNLGNITAQQTSDLNDPWVDTGSLQIKEDKAYITINSNNLLSIYYRIKYGLFNTDYIYVDMVEIITQIDSEQTINSTTNCRVIVYGPNMILKYQK